MNPAMKRMLIALLLTMWMSGYVVPFAVFAHGSGTQLYAASGVSVADNVYGGTVGGSVYGGGACKPLSASGTAEWKKLLKPVMEPGKVTFTIDDGYCETELSLTSYAYPDGVKPQSDGKPYDKQTVYRNVTAKYGPGKHTAAVELPCGYWQLDFYAGPLVSKLNPDYGHSPSSLIDWLHNVTESSCSSSSDSSSDDSSSSDSTSSSITSSNSSSNGSAGITTQPPTAAPTPAVQAPVAAAAESAAPSLELLIAKALCTDKPDLVRFQLENQSKADLTFVYGLAGDVISREMRLSPGESKIIEFASKGKPSLQISANGRLKTPVEAKMDLCTPTGTGSMDSGNTGGIGGSSGNGGSATPGSGGNGSTPSTGLETLDTDRVPTGSLVNPGVVNSANGAGEQGQPVTLNDEPVALGYSVLPQTGEGIPWAYYMAGALLMLLGIAAAWKARRNG